jgi:hypothetical protein
MGSVTQVYKGYDPGRVYHWQGTVRRLRQAPATQRTREKNTCHAAKFDLDGSGGLAEHDLCVLSELFEKRLHDCVFIVV